MKRKFITLLSKIITYCNSYIELCLWLLIFAIGIRFFEAILLNQIKSGFGSILIWNLQGLCYDISLYLRMGVVILPIFVVTCFLSAKKSRIIFRILQSLMLLLSLICIVFFTTSGFLLDKIIFSYSPKELLDILNSSTKSPVWVYCVVAGLPILYFFLSGKRFKINNIIITISFFILTILSFFILNKITPRTNQYHIKVNKEYFFFKSAFERSKTPSVFKENDVEMIKKIKKFQSYFPDLQFEGIEYPFLYQAVYNDVLSPFFDLKPKLPNFVFVIVEGLGYEFFKNDYQLMPFLDSLSKQSLSWEHCLSASSRTFGVLPAIFGASPLGEKGFLDQCPKNPEYQSLLRILHQNYYTNRFFYGGWIGFDNMGYFFDENNTSYLKNNDWDQDIIDQKTENTWGHEDHLTYLQALRILKKQSSLPRTDIYMSLSTHDPFVHSNKDYYQEIVKNKVQNCKTLSKQEKKDILSSLSTYGCFAYADWSLQQLFEGYKKRDDFDNTIFIITGDHHAIAQQFAGYVNYHVPLIIYSPMLKSGRNMKGVVSHRDITPTLLSLLHQNFDITSPDEVTWLNTALDTSLTFNANTFSPLQMINHTLEGIMYKNYMISEGIVEEFVDGDAPRKIEDTEVSHQMNRLLNLYQSVDLYTFYNDALIRNPYSHEAFANVIFDVEDSIAADSYFAQDSKLQVVEAPEGHETALYFDVSNPNPIKFLEFDIPNNIERFRVELEFTIYVKNYREGEYLAVIEDISNNNKHAFYIAHYLGENIQNQWYTYKNVFTYKKDIYASLGKKSRYLLYISNGSIEGFIDNIRIKCITD